MLFIPAIEALSPATEQAWCMAFHDGKLLLPEGDDAPLAPLPFLRCHQ